MVSTKAQEAVSSPTVKDDARASRMTRPPASPKCFLLIGCNFLGRSHNFMLAGWLGAYNPVKSLGHLNGSPMNCTDEFFQLRTRESSVHSTMLCSVFLAPVAIFTDPRAQRRQLAPWKRASVGRRSRQVPPTRSDDNPRRSSTSVGVDEFGSRWHSTSNLPLEWTKGRVCARVRACVWRFEKVDGNVLHSCHQQDSTAQFLIHH